MPGYRSAYRSVDPGAATIAVIGTAAGRIATMAAITTITMADGTGAIATGAIGGTIAGAIADLNESGSSGRCSRLFSIARLATNHSVFSAPMMRATLPKMRR